MNFAETIVPGHKSAGGLGGLGCPGLGAQFKLS
jgi:hypothetical protein